MSTQDRQGELEEQRGYGAAKDDVDEKTPDQAQQRHSTGEADDKTKGGLAEQAQAEESGRGREAS